MTKSFALSQNFIYHMMMSYIKETGMLVNILLTKLAWLVRYMYVILMNSDMGVFYTTCVLT